MTANQEPTSQYRGRTDPAYIASQLASSIKDRIEHIVQFTVGEAQQGVSEQHAAIKSNEHAEIAQRVWNALKVRFDAILDLLKKAEDLNTSHDAIPTQTAMATITVTMGTRSETISIGDGITGKDGKVKDLKQVDLKDFLPMFDKATRAALGLPGKMVSQHRSQTTNAKALVHRAKKAYEEFEGQVQKAVHDIAQETSIYQSQVRQALIEGDTSRLSKEVIDGSGYRKSHPDLFNDAGVMMTGAKGRSNPRNSNGPEEYRAAMTAAAARETTKGIKFSKEPQRSLPNLAHTGTDDVDWVTDRPAPASNGVAHNGADKKPTPSKGSLAAQAITDKDDRGAEMRLKTGAV